MELFQEGNNHFIDEDYDLAILVSNDALISNVSMAPHINQILRIFEFVIRNIQS
jgi:hypothetical protein